MEVNSFAIIAGGVFLLIFIVTYFLHLIFEQKRYVKYLPGILLLGLSGYNYYLSINSPRGYQDLGNLFATVFLLGGFMCVLLVGLILDVVVPRLNRKGR